MGFEGLQGQVDHIAYRIACGTDVSSDVDELYRSLRGVDARTRGLLAATVEGDFDRHPKLDDLMDVILG